MRRLSLSIGLLLCLGGCHQGDGDSYYEDQEEFRFDAGPQGGVEVTPELPLYVDEWFGPSGYMGDGEDGLIESTPCPVRPSMGLGTCHRFAWTQVKGWAGVFWQFPDGNWGTTGGLAMPAGAQTVRFTAWGQTGTEVVTFGAGRATWTVSRLSCQRSASRTHPRSVSSTFRCELPGDCWRLRVDLRPIGFWVVFYVDEIRWDSTHRW